MRPREKQRAALVVLSPLVALAACQNLNVGAASGGNSTAAGPQAGNSGPQGQGLVQCATGSPECFALCGSPSCALLDAAIPSQLDTPVIYLPDGNRATSACDAVEQESMLLRERACKPCHSPPQRLGNFNYVLDDAKLVTSTSNSYTDDAGMPLRMVVPGSPEQSWLYQRVTLGQMPPPPSTASGILGPQAAMSLLYPTAADESVLYGWIDCLGSDGGGYGANYTGATYGPVPEGGAGYWGSSGASGNDSGSASGSSGGAIGNNSSGNGSGSSGIGSSSGQPSSSSGSSSGSASSSSSSSSGGASSSSSFGSSGGSGSSSSSSSGSSSSGGPACNAAADTAQYNFERSTQGWMGNGAPITGVATSTAEAFAGCQSLAITFNGGGATTQALVNGGQLPPAGALVTFHVWIPAGSTIRDIQPFVQQGADGGFAFTGNFVPIANLTAGSWNTITLRVPANAITPLRNAGIEFTTTASWMGTVYLDAIGW